MQRFLTITLPHWPVTARARLQSGPVLVVHRVRGAKVVRAACRRARERSVAAGMPLAQARALLDAPATELDHLPSIDRRALRRLARWCGRWAPRVQVLDRIDPPVIVLDITGCERVHGGEDRLLPRVRRAMDRARVECTLWSACTQAAAMVAGWPDGGAPRARAHDGIVKQGDERWCTRDRPVQALRLDDALVQALHEVNIRTVDDLRSVQRVQVAARFGHAALDRLDAIVGQVFEPFDALPSVVEPMHDVRFDGPCPQLEALCAAVEQCVTSVGHLLKERQCGARAWCIRVDCADLPARLCRSDPEAHTDEAVRVGRAGDMSRADGAGAAAGACHADDAARSAHAWTVRCTEPVREWSALRPLLWPTLQELPMGHGVERVRVVARSLRRMPPGQHALHTQRTLTAHGALWIDGVRERLGAGAVACLRPNARRADDWQATLLSIEDHAHDDAIADATAWPTVELPSQPTQRWPRPEPAHTLEPGSTDAGWPEPPRRFRWRGTVWERTAAHGPQRVSPAWWQRANLLTHDHWRVQVQQGVWLSMVRTVRCASVDGTADAWWVQGAWT